MTTNAWLRCRLDELEREIRNQRNICPHCGAEVRDPSRACWCQRMPPGRTPPDDLVEIVIDLLTDEDGEPLRQLTLSYDDVRELLADALRAKRTTA